MLIHLQGTTNMRKVHVLLTKEDISPEKLASGKKIAVVLDILLATTTIVTALQHGATEVIPVLNSDEAIKVSRQFENGQALMAGELHAKPIDGFFYPGPVEISQHILGKALILSTTNGTVALHKAAHANQVYIASLLNNASVAETILNDGLEDTIIVICSGNSGEFSLEDFYGAGHLIANIKGRTNEEIGLNDAGKAAFAFYNSHSSDPVSILAASRVGQLLTKHGLMEDLLLSGTSGSHDVVPVLLKNRIVLTAEREG